MSELPSVKGAIIASVMQGVEGLVSEGVISRDDFERRLEPDDRKLLDGHVQVAQWYDMRIYSRILEAIRELGGGGDDFLRERGRLAAERMVQAGVYQQFEYLNRTQVQRETDPEKRRLAFGRDLRLLITFSAHIYNFSRWEVKPDPDWPDRWMIEVTDAAPFSDAFVPSSEGFINRMASQHDAPDLWRGERPEPDRILFRMARAL